MKIPITQSKAWGALQDDLGKVSYREEGSGYQYLAILTESKLAKYLYLPYGPVTKDRKGFENAVPVWDGDRLFPKPPKSVQPVLSTTSPPF